MNKSGVISIAIALLTFGCGLNNAKKQYVLAEKFWTDGNYKAAVSEFERVYGRDPHGALGIQALYRAATTQAYFLSQYAEAIRKLRTFSELTSDKSAAWNAKAEMGDIFFQKMELYQEAATQYANMVAENPSHPDAPLYLFREARAQFFLWRFADALKTYEKLMKDYPQSTYAERGMYEIGVTYFTRGDQERKTSGKESYQDAIDAFEEFLKKYPKSEWVPQAKFGIASCLEEMDQLDAAYQAYEALKSTYPSPNVIMIKLVRIRERKAQRSR